MQGNVNDEFVKHGYSIFQLKDENLPSVALMVVDVGEVLKKYKLSEDIKLTKESVYKFYDDFVSSNLDNFLYTQIS